MGRHKRKFTDEQIAEMEEMALQGCQNGTIASKMGLDRELIFQRKDILTILGKKRAERKLNLRIVQTKMAKTQPAMAIFLGKNELGQVDKQNIQQEIITPTLPDAEQDALTEVAKEFKVKLA